MEWWENAVVPVRRVWGGVSSRLGFRKSEFTDSRVKSLIRNARDDDDETGIVMLRREVKACEYEDVQIMWKMLKRTDTDQSPRTKKRDPLAFWNQLFQVHWSRSSPSCLRRPSF